MKLDLRGNSNSQVQNIDKAASLKTLDLGMFEITWRFENLLMMLGNNELADFSIHTSLPNLTDLNLEGNNLRCLDLSPFPKLNRLNVDSNTISALQGALQLHHLSWRSQKAPPDIQKVETICDLHTLLLSSNPFTTFSPPQPFLNLQHLEIASAGLSDLDADLGLRCPNLRTVNMNFNALRELRPLLGIQKLQRLHLAGNRLSRMRRTVAVLELLSKGESLVELDMRNNPLTLGFYAPQDRESTIRKQTQLIRTEDEGHYFNEEDEEVDTFAQAADKYYLPALDVKEDVVARERLDEDTKLRRRVYEMMLGQAWIRHGIDCAS